MQPLILKQLLFIAVPEGYYEENLIVIYSLQIIIFLDQLSLFLNLFVTGVDHQY